MSKPQLIEELLSRARRHPTIIFTMIDLLNAGLPITRSNLKLHGRLTDLDLDKFYYLWFPYSSPSIPATLALVA